MKRIDTYWYSKSAVVLLLLPLSWIYCGLSSVRRWLYRLEILKSSSVPVPVVVVGNIMVGGTGKTPLLIELCDLLESNGLKPGVISRGYKGEFCGEMILTEDSTPEEVGDEPFIIFKRTRCPVSVGKNRVAAARLLLDKHKCDVILSDDGLQHYKMKRDCEVAIVDTNRMHGNGYCLPAGPLREPVKRLRSVDLVVYHGDAGQDYSFSLEFSSAVNLLTGEIRSIEKFKDKKVHAIAGIGHPSRFFDQLRYNGLNVIEHPFQDHHIFKESDLDFNDKNIILMTEKDAVKCSFYNNNNAWYIPVSARLSKNLASRFIDDIKRLVNEKRTS